MVEESTQLITLDAFRQALVEAETIPEIKNLTDQADLFRRWLKKQRAGHSALNAGLEMKLLAERNVGGLLNADPDIKPGGDRKSSRHNVRMKLSNYGITEKQSERWQRLSEIPEEHLTRYISELGEIKELSTAGNDTAVPRNE